MASKYYARFFAGTADAPRAGEFSGVVEMAVPLPRHRETRELRRALARDHDLDADDIRILHWARLH
jgi:hypothetical protein